MTFRTSLLFLASVLVLGSGVSAGVIADYNGDFWGGGTWKTGWSYLWNDGAIGTESNYKKLGYWWPEGNAYINSGKYPDPNPIIGYAAAAHGPSGGWSCPGSTSTFSIACYQVQTGQAGIGSITSSSITIPSGKGDGVEVQVYVNNTLKGTVPVTGTTGSFDMGLGALAVGDRVYVAVGSGPTVDYDTFQISYEITTGQ
jgi:hypothetical protein